MAPPTPRTTARFELLCSRLRPDLVRFAFWLSGDRAMAEDAVQEAMLRAWHHVDALANEAAAKAWLLTIVRRELARAHQRKPPPGLDIDALSGEDQACLASEPANDDLDAVRQALWRLAPEYREPLMMQVVVGLSTKEIAAQLALTQATVLTRLFRAREKLRLALLPPEASGQG